MVFTPMYIWEALISVSGLSKMKMRETGYMIGAYEKILRRKMDNGCDHI